MHSSSAMTVVTPDQKLAIEFKKNVLTIVTALLKFARAKYREWP